MPFELKLSDIVKAVSGELLPANGPDETVVGFETDSRKKFERELFIPLKGENHDAHDFINGAIQNGAKFILTHKQLAPVTGVSFILVDDTLKALQNLASYWRHQNSYKVIAITGSNGKTTSKEYAASLIRRHKSVTASVGSFNNHWGVPFTILNSNKNDDVLILEMGMNHSGELTDLSNIGQQDVAVVTTVGLAHVGEVGSIEEVAKAKQEIYNASPNAIHIFNKDNEHTQAMIKSSNSETHLTFSNVDTSADVCLQVSSLTEAGMLIKGKISGFEGEAIVPIIGDHNVSNVMVAACVALTVDIDPAKIWESLPFVKGAWGRCDLFQIEKGSHVLFDAYNSNPQSVNALHKNVQSMQVKGKKVLVFADMLEMGEHSYELHKQVFESLSGAYEVVWYIGEHKEIASKLLNIDDTKYFYSQKFNSDIAIEVYKQFEADDLIIFKGSRGYELEQILQKWGHSYHKIN